MHRKFVKFSKYFEEAIIIKIVTNKINALKYLKGFCYLNNRFENLSEEKIFENVSQETWVYDTLGNGSERKLLCRKMFVGVYSDIFYYSIIICTFQRTF